MAAAGLFACGTLIDPEDAPGPETDGGPPPPPVPVHVPPGCSDAPTCDPSICPVTKLYEPAEDQEHTEYPHAIAASATHVYWVALADADNDPTGAYDGRGLATVRRVKKVGGAAEVIARNQVDAKELALTQSHVYWSGHEGEGGEQRFVVRRAALGCTAPCAEETVWRSDAPGTVQRLAAIDDDNLLALTESGDVFALRVGFSKPKLAGHKDGVFPALTVNKRGAFVASAMSDTVERVDPEGERLLPLATFPPNVAAPLPGEATARPGAKVLAAGCDDLWALRAPATLFGMITSGTPDGGVDVEVDLPAAADFWDAVADARYLYIGAANGGGLTFASRGKPPTFGAIKPGESAWRLAVDGDGLYWGAHGTRDVPGSAGTIFMMKKR